jgi:ABC-type polysaccharide/polyol phosphate transport system ATPase subunit
MIRSICNKVVWLEHGVIKKFGQPDAVVTAYQGAGGASVTGSPVRVL